MVLHHVDVEAKGSEMAHVLTPQGRVVWVETSARNPLLMFTRRFLTGKSGIVRLAMSMEHPFTFTEVKGKAHILLYGVSEGAGHFVYVKSYISS